ncbi:MAG: gluconokinase, GntK/IdnK-type [Gemmatimonadaceae bacterium]
MTSESKTDVRVIVVMGVSGAGKTTVGRALAQALEWEFQDADDYHTPEHIAKMHRGEGLTDEDRWPWLAALCDMIADVAHGHRRAVLACSALKHWYRTALIPPDVAPGAVQFVYLDVPVEVLRERLADRAHHFATPALLTSQLATLEVPREALCVDGTLPVAEIVRLIRRGLVL